MDTTTLQVPISKNLKASASAVAKDSGFSSLQEVVRFMLTKFARKEIGISIEQFPATPLSTKNENRYIKMSEDFKKGKNIYSSYNADEFLKKLSS